MHSHIDMLVTQHLYKKDLMTKQLGTYAMHGLKFITKIKNTQHRHNLITYQYGAESLAWLILDKTRPD